MKLTQSRVRFKVVALKEDEYGRDRCSTVECDTMSQAEMFASFFKQCGYYEIRVEETIVFDVAD